MSFLDILILLPLFSFFIFDISKKFRRYIYNSIIHDTAFVCYLQHIVAHKCSWSVVNHKKEALIIFYSPAV